MMTNISEEDLALLTFPTTTTQDTEGSVSLVGALVYLLNSDPITSIRVPGFSAQMVSIFDSANSQAFLNGQPSFQPFSAPFYEPVSPPTNTKISVSAYLDDITSSLPFGERTFNSVKTFSLVFRLANDATTNEGVGSFNIGPIHVTSHY